MEEEERTLAELEKVGIGLTEHSEKMVYLGTGQGLFCRACGTKVEDGRVCGAKLAAVFWYCPTCDEFLEWHGFGITEETTGQCQTSLRPFLRWLRHHPERGEGNNERHHRA